MPANVPQIAPVASPQLTAPGTHCEHSDADKSLLALMRRLERCQSRAHAIEIVTSRVSTARSLQALTLITLPGTEPDSARGMQPIEAGQSDRRGQNDPGGRGDQRHQSVTMEPLCGTPDLPRSDVTEERIALAVRACREQRPVVVTTSEVPDQTVMAVQVTSPSDSQTVFVAVLEPSADWRETQSLVQSAATAFSYWSALHALRVGTEPNTGARDPMSCWVDVLSRGSLKHAGQTLVEQLAEACGAQTVALGQWNAARETTDVLAISSTKRFDPRSERTSQYRAAFDECTIRGRITLWSRTNPDDEQSSLIVKHLAESFGCDAICCVPLHATDTDSQYMFMFLGDGPSAQRACSLVDQHAQLAQAMLNLHRRAEAGGIAGVAERCRSWFAARKNRAIVIACLTLLAGLFLPVTHKVRCDCVTQPVTRRFVVAPFDGILKTVLVRLGDRVAPGQVLARMDDREIEWELASIASELERARSQRDGHIAVKDFVAAELVRYEIDRLMIRERLLLHRKDTLAVKSPIGGLVIAGDLADSEGAPVSVGQGLFEVAPLDELVVEAEIPEDQISHVRTGLPIEIHTEALPHRRWRRELERVHPQTELRDERYAFIGETVIENRDRALRPGMHGTVAIHAGLRPLGWCLFHRAWERIRIWTGW